MTKRTNEPDVRVELVTKAKAHDYLGRNTANRNLRQRVVDTYARDMTNGDWKWNGEAIKFSEDGTLLDGQHRLAAIVQSGASVRMLVVRGLPDDTQATMDAGAKRKFSDTLSLNGEANAAALAAICRSVTLWEAGRRDFTGQTSNAELQRTLDRYPQLREAARLSNRINSHSRLPQSVFGLTWWLFNDIDEEDAEYFFERLASDEGHYKGEPIHALRNALSPISGLRSGGERSAKFLVAITIKAWNRYRDGKPCGLLRFRMGGKSPEAFPEPK